MASQNRQNMRSPLARAIGLGSAKEGVGPWWAERVSAVALVPLTLWFAASTIAHTGSDYATFVVWLRTPLAAILMILLLIAFLSHGAWSAGRDRGLRPFRDQVRGRDCYASWLLRPRDRGCRSHPAHRAQRLRRTVRALRNPAIRPAQFVRSRWIESMLRHSGKGQAGRQCDVCGETAASGAWVPSREWLKFEGGVISSL